MVVRELFVRLGFRLDDTRPIDNTIDRMRGALAGLAAAFSLRKIIDIADQMQSLRSRIGMLPQTIGDAGDAFDDVSDRAIAARSSIQAYGQLYVRLAGATSSFIKSQDEVLLITDAISQALVIGGANAAEAASATLQLSQAFQKGKLDGDEFRSFMENLSSDFKDKLAAELGTTKDKFFELSSSGQLTTRKLAEAFKRMAPEISKQMMTIPMTVGQATTIVVSRFSRMIDRMNRESKFVTRIADGILKSFDKIESGVDSIVDKFGGWDNTLRIIGITILTAFGAKAIKVIMAFNLATALAFARFAIIATAIILVAALLDDLWVAIQGGESYLGDFYTWLTNGSAGATALGLALTALSGATVAWAAISAAKYIQVAFAATMAGLAAIRSGAMIAAGWLIAMGPIGLVIAAIAGIGVAGYLIMENWKDIKQWFSDTFDWFGNKFKELAGWLNNVFNKAVGNPVSTIEPGNTVATIEPNEAIKIVKEKAKNVIESVNPEINNKNVFQNQITQAQMVPSGSKSVVDNRQTNVTVTVPPGTSQEQATFLQKAAQTSFADMNKPLKSMDMATYSD